jgi:hypothetical protein
LRQSDGRWRIAPSRLVHIPKATACDSVNVVACHQGERIDKSGNILMRESAGKCASDKMQPFDMLRMKSKLVVESALSSRRLQ